MSGAKERSVAASSAEKPMYRFMSSKKESVDIAKEFAEPLTSQRTTHVIADAVAPSLKVVHLAFTYVALRSPDREHRKEQHLQQRPQADLQHRKDWHDGRVRPSAGRDRVRLEKGRGQRA